MKTLLISAFLIVIAFTATTKSLAQRPKGVPQCGQECLDGDCPPPPPPLPPGMDAPPPPPPPPAGPGMEQHRGSGHPRGVKSKKFRNKVENRLKKLKENNPEEFERLMNLRRENPMAFRKEIHKRFKKQFKKEHPEAFKKMQEMKEIRKEISKLSKEYNKCEDEKAKAEIKNKIEELVNKSFDITQELREKEIANLEKRTKGLRKKLRKRVKNKKDIVNLRVKGIIDGEDTVR